MNKTLERQIKKIFGNIESVPPNLYPFLKVVSDTYDSAEEDRKLIERSLEISSKELGGLNEKLRAESDAQKKNIDELARMNKLMVDRELKMIELKKENQALKSQIKS